MIAITGGEVNRTPEERERAYKEELRLARLHLLNAQVIIRPYDERYTQIEEILESLEQMIIKRSNP